MKEEQMGLSDCAGPRAGGGSPGSAERPWGAQGHPCQSHRQTLTNKPGEKRQPGAQQPAAQAQTQGGRGGRAPQLHARHRPRRTTTVLLTQGGRGAALRWHALGTHHMLHQLLFGAWQPTKGRQTQ